MKGSRVDGKAKGAHAKNHIFIFLKWIPLIEKKGPARYYIM